MAGGYKGLTGVEGKPFTKNDKRINRRGRPKRLPELDWLLAELMTEEMNGKMTAEWILISLRRRCFKGDVRACELLLDRSWGKQTTKGEMTLDFDLKTMTEEQLTAICDHIFKKESHDK
jgi:hypothetical protein